MLQLEAGIAKHCLGSKRFGFGVASKRNCDIHASNRLVTSISAFPIPIEPAHHGRFGRASLLELQKNNFDICY